MRKLVIFLVVATAALFLIGIPQLWTALRYRSPVAVAYTGQAADLPAFVQLEDIHLLGSEALWTNGRRGTKIYIPVHVANPAAEEQVSLILESDDPELITTIARSGGKQSAEKSLKLIQAFAQKRTATGMVHASPADLDLDKELRGLTPKLAKDYYVLTESESPSLGLGLFGVIFGSGTLALLNWIRKRHAQHQQEPAEPPPLAAEPPKFT